MENLKKFLKIILICIISNSFCCRESSALLANSHFNLGRIIIEQSGIKLSETEKKAFLSGLVYADIGRFKFDKTISINSDSLKFVEEMKKYATTSEELWFVRGFEVHVFQDEKTEELLKKSLSRKNSSYLEYIKNCGILDNYFLRKTKCYIFNEFLSKFDFDQIIQGMNRKKIIEILEISEDKIKTYANSVLDRYSGNSNKYKLVLYADLIKNTYHSLGFKISVDDIYKQAANVLGASILADDFASKNELPEDLAHNIEVESNKLATLCISEFNLIDVKPTS